MAEDDSPLTQAQCQNHRAPRSAKETMMTSQVRNVKYPGVRGRDGNPSNPERFSCSFGERARLARSVRRPAEQIGCADNALICAGLPRLEAIGGTPMTVTETGRAPHFRLNRPADLEKQLRQWLTGESDRGAEEDG